MSQDSEPLKFREKMGYGLGDVASCLFWQTFAIYLANFYTDIFGLAPAVVATMLLVTRCWDLGYDLVMGVIADRTSTRWGKFRPYLLWVPIPLGIAAILTFTTPELSTTGKLIYAYLTYGALMLFYSTVNVPYAALLGVMTSRPADRTALSSWRMIGAFVGSSIVTYTNYGLAYYFSVSEAKLSDALQMAVTTMTKAFSTTGTAAAKAVDKTIITPSGYQATMIVFSVLAVLVFWLTFALTKERIVPPKPQRGSWKRDFADLFRNRPWLILVGVTILKNSFAGIRGGMIVYYFKYYVNSEALSAMYLLLGNLASIAGIYLVQFMPVSWGKKVPYIVSIALAGLFSLLSYWVGPTDFTLMFVCQILISFFIGPPNSMLWGMYADTADHSELKNGRRATGLIFSASGMAQKLGWTIASSLGLYLLGYYAFKANVEQTPEALTGIVMLVSMIPAGCCFLAAIIMAIYPLNAIRMKEVEEGLRSVRKKEAST